MSAESRTPSVPDSERLTLRISEHENGWAYAIYDGDGSEPGSLHSMALSASMDTAITEGHNQLVRQLHIRNCQHDWQPYGHGLMCQKCRTFDWPTNPRTKREWPTEAVA